MPSALYRSGMNHLNGANGVKRNRQEGVKLITKAAWQNCPHAQRELGWLNLDDNPEETYIWWHIAVKNGYLEAGWHDDAAKVRGVDVIAAKDKAERRYKIITEPNGDEAQYAKAVKYENGEGVPPSDVEAYILYSLAAVKGHAEAIEARDRLAEKLSAADLSSAKAEVVRRHKELHPKS